MNHKRQNQIEQLAKDLLLQTDCYTQPPINVKMVAEKLGLGVIEFAFGEDISGVLITENGVSTIGVNVHNNPKRKRFTMAHEIGHYRLGHQRSGMFVDTVERFYTMFNFRNAASSTGEHLQEREANAFAAALLMPKELLIECFEDIKSRVDVREESVDITKKLADIFEVNIQAMSFRLTNLNTLW